MSNLLVYLNPVQIVSRVEARAIKADGVERLKAKINRLGFQADKPIRVYPYKSGYRLIDGSHRLQAAIAEGLESIPALVVEPPATELEAIKQARESNEASETVVPTTFVDDAELIWRMLKDNTQQEVATALGWKQQRVQQYKALQQISNKSWQFITTTFEDFVVELDDDAVVENTTTVVKGLLFTENLLRNIVTLNPRQQFDLVSRLASQKINRTSGAHACASNSKGLEH